MTPGSFERVYAQLTAALGARVGVACTGVNGDPQTLHVEERAAIASAVSRRQREYAAGRTAVREAMSRIGEPAQPVPSGPDRAPIWPEGLTGSISHTRHICVAVVGRKQDIGSIGIDIEERVPLAPELWESICTTEEQHHLQTLPEAQRGLRVAQLFIAKEAFYKWQYPLTGRLLDFKDAVVQVNSTDTGFAVGPAHPLRWPDLHEVVGGLHLEAEWMLAWVCGPPDRMQGEVTS